MRCQIPAARAYALINGITLNQIIFDNFISPLTEFYTSFRVNTITHRYYHIKIIHYNSTINRAFTLLTNLSEIPTCCFLFQFLIFINVLYMFQHVST